MTISVINQKGGSGKTATAISISSCLARLGYRVLLVDLDQQRNASRVLLRDYHILKAENTVAAFVQSDPPTLLTYATNVPNLAIVPAHTGLSGADIELFNIINREKNLDESLTELKGKYDFIILDCPPDLGLITINALSTSDYLIITVEPSVDGVEGSKLVMETVPKIKKKLNDKLELLGVLMTMSEATVISRDIGNMLSKEYENLFFRTRIPRNVALPEAHGANVDIFGYNPKSTSALAYSKLVKTEILPKLGL